MAKLVLEINKEFEDQSMSHGNVAAKKLKDHTQEELLSLAILAKRSNNPILLRCFKTIPILKVLVEEKADIDQEKINTENGVFAAPKVEEKKDEKKEAPKS